MPQPFKPGLATLKEDIQARPSRVPCSEQKFETFTLQKTIKKNVEALRGQAKGGKGKGKRARERATKQKQSGADGAQLGNLEMRRELFAVAGTKYNQSREVRAGTQRASASQD